MHSFPLSPSTTPNINYINIYEKTILTSLTAQHDKENLDFKMYHGKLQIVIIQFAFKH